MAWAKSIAELIGNTPLLELTGVEKHLKLSAKLLAKLECKNPAGSAKDRPAYQMILDAEEKGLLPPGGTIIEPTSGNTGIALAAIAAAKGYRAIFTMPDSMSVERQKLLKAYGAQVVLTPGEDGMAGAIARAEALHASIPGSIIAGQFSNPANPQSHFETTGPEIWRQTEGMADALVAGVGTGGTITGAGKYLKSKNPAIHVAAVEPAGSPLLSGGKAGPHGLMGIGANFIPEALDRTVLDEVLPVTEQDAYAMARLVAAQEGVLIGISSGAALAAAVSIAKRDAFAGKNIVVVFPDGGERYLSTTLFGE
ncbi:MAG: cysteine synthase A [Eubacteriales bacterium]|nr:cysteine synthase A [Eubacteriales bacterium]